MEQQCATWQRRRLASFLTLAAVLSTLPTGTAPQEAPAEFYGLTELTSVGGAGSPTSGLGGAGGQQLGGSSPGAFYGLDSFYGFYGLGPSAVKQSANGLFGIGGGVGGTGADGGQQIGGPLAEADSFYGVDSFYGFYGLALNAVNQTANGASLSLLGIDDGGVSGAGLGGGGGQQIGGPSPDDVECDSIYGLCESFYGFYGLDAYALNHSADGASSLFGILDPNDAVNQSANGSSSGAFLRGGQQIGGPFPGDAECNLIYGEGLAVQHVESS
jgi:hypothetical protein